MELTLDQALQKGIEAHKAGKVQEADRYYTAILKADPKHPDANHNMGVLAVDVGKVETALPFFRAALEVNQTIAQHWISYIDALINLDKLTAAQGVLDQAKSKGAKGDGFDKLEQRLKEAGQEPLETSKITAEVPPQQPNILDSLKLGQAIKLAKKKEKEGASEDAKRIYQDILEKFPKNKRASDGLKTLVSRPVGKVSKVQDAPQNQLQALINLHSQGQLQQALKQAETLVQQFPQSPVLFNIQGAVLKGLGQLDLSIEAYNKALSIKPDYAEAYYNIGIILKEQGKLEEAIDAYNKALSIKPDYADAYNNMGNSLRDQGKPEEAIDAYNKALTIKPDYAEVCNNMGIAFQEQGKLEEAIEAYNRALAIKPDYANAYNNMGITFKEQGKLEEAVKVYHKAIAIKPDYAEAHRHLSILTKYTPDNQQISDVCNLLLRQSLNESDRCHLHYACAKMKEDLGDLSGAFDNYLAGAALKKKLLAYDFGQDKNLFASIKNTASQFKDVAIHRSGELNQHTPIFILGMPRSGTTLVEQIVSSHTAVTGAGELDFVEQFGKELAVGLEAPTEKAVAIFQERYLAELAKKANGQAFITDKMPQNFRFIALIYAAFPETKIVHVQRTPEATCWSNFKHSFASKGLGYSYDLADIVAYYGLYENLMDFWYQSYRDRIYNLDYDKLTEDQETETRRLIEYLGLDWEDACLAPQKNKRPVKTSSQGQVQQKMYKGSSQAWRKYKLFLDGKFDKFKA